MVDELYRQRRPSPPLQAFVHTMWIAQRPARAHASEWNLPTGCADLVLPLGDGDRIARLAGDGSMAAPAWQHSGAVVQGLQQRATRRDTSRPARTAGVHFRPGGLAALFDLPAHELTDRVVPLRDLWGPFADELRERVARAPDADAALDRLDAMLRKRLRPHAVDPLARWALSQLLHGDAPLAQLQRASGLAPSTFVARLRRVLGVAPQRQRALLRFAQAVRHGHTLRGERWADIAFDTGFADQAHLTREFTRFAGMTPGGYRQHATAHAMHVAAR